MKDEEEYCWCHRDLEDEDNFDCDDYMECTECLYYNSYEEDD